ncbi:DinB family protein [[Brevibacterium] frigoritolerans]|uniref:DinB family protein n=1 Tax=Peribacillus frigoritolerans TaxID=450367 RepID=A0A941FSW3_9BACI|nr:DinB family protein [Peribacillus frigoritolerans]
MAYQEIRTSIQSVQQSIDHILETTANLPEETIRFKPAEDEWSIMQILSHLAEAIPYWLGEVETVIAMPGAEWGVDCKIQPDWRRLPILTNLLWMMS